MNRADHHARAEQLLEQARTTPDQISRREILAEAQVHAALALSAPAGKGPPGPGRDEAADIKSTGAAHPGMPKDGGPVPGWQAGEPYPPSAPGGFYGSASRGSERRGGVPPASRLPTRDPGQSGIGVAPNNP